MQLRAGELDRRISLLVASPSQDPNTGEEVPGVPLELGPDWAKAEPVITGRAGETYTGDELAAIADFRFLIRYRDDVGPGDGITPKKLVIRYKERLYDVQRVNELGRRQALELLAKARAE
jgi:head-tail adaptor